MTINIPKGKSLALAYFLLAVLGLQGAHQFYLGNYLRGITLATLIHLPIFAFAYMLEKAGNVPNLVGEMFGIVPLLLIWFALLAGIILFLADVFTLKKQLKDPPNQPPQQPPKP